MRFHVFSASEPDLRRFTVEADALGGVDFLPALNAALTDAVESGRLPLSRLVRDEAAAFLADPPPVKFVSVSTWLMRELETHLRSCILERWFSDAVVVADESAMPPVFLTELFGAADPDALPLRIPVNTDELRPSVLAAVPASFRKSLARCRWRPGFAAVTDEGTVPVWPEYRAETADGPVWVSGRRLCFPTLSLNDGTETGTGNLLSLAEPERLLFDLGFFADAAEEGADLTGTARDEWLAVCLPLWEERCRQAPIALKWLTAIDDEKQRLRAAICELIGLGSSIDGIPTKRLAREQVKRLEGADRLDVLRRIRNGGDLPF